MVVDDKAVVQHGHIRRADQGLSLEARAGPEDVVALPLARLAAGVDERRILPVDRGRGAVRIGEVIVTVQHLDLIASHQEHAAVTPSLALALDDRWGGPLQVDLAVPELLAGLDISRAGNHLHVAVLDLPR